MYVITTIPITIMVDACTHPNACIRKDSTSLMTMHVTTTKTISINMTIDDNDDGRHNNQDGP